MPHLKTAPFETARLDALVGTGGPWRFRAVEEGNSVELLGVEFGGGTILLEIKKRPDAVIVRPDKITRPLDVEGLKALLARLAEEADLEVLHANIDASRRRPPLASAYDKSIRDFEEPRFPLEKVALEVGFGSGRHLLWQAERNPDTLFIGVEIHTPSAQQVLRQIGLRGLTNVWVVNYDARLLMEMLPSNRLEAVYVHFPVPWDKKPHRRVISDAFVAETMRVLRPGGFLELRTDSENYYRYALEVFSRPPKVDFWVEKNRDLPVVSKYEARWRRMEKNIYTLTMRSLERSPERGELCDFSLEGIDPSRVAALDRRPVVREGYFVHFSHRYRLTTGGGGLIECSFGSFDRPEHKYILYTDAGEGRYLPDVPVRTATNCRAHHLIRESLHG
ncbi:tRNA (guanosine(46)-N7)-methyltransferase TrmB [Nitratifractor sp.]